MKIVNKKKYLSLFLLVLGIAIAVAIYFALHNQIIKPSYSTNTTAQTTSSQRSAQSDFSQGDDSKKVNTSPRNEGTISQDSNQQAPATSADKWSSSQDGSTIVVFNPTKSQVLESGHILNGTANTPTVDFRLIDDVSGVIASGSLAVNNGKFQGIFNFSTKAKNGQLDLFTSSHDGVESNNVSIPVRFK